MENDSPVIYGLEFQVCDVSALICDVVALKIYDICMIFCSHYEMGVARADDLKIATCSAVSH